METKIKPFKPHIIHSNKPLSDFALPNLLQQVMQHKIILLRDTPALTRDELLSYCQQNAQLLSWDFGAVMDMKVDEPAKNYLFTAGDVPLHWDGAFYQEPRFLLFQCIEAPEAGSGGETLFVNTERVWQESSEQQKKQWSDYSFTFQTEKLAHYGGAISRPMINQHPATGEIILRFAEPVGEDYLNPVTVALVNKTARESARIIQQISALGVFALKASF